ncbi:MAG TPA: Rieske 2Fe-2S domain-containing protein [Candidatus Acidoferrum sp.]|nr:Rieske 2Fe-2S domain-containing protein [Candidatus Acidoferrum sp.]
MSSSASGKRTSDTTRRTFLKALIIFSGALVLLPLQSLSAYLLERKSGTASYPRVKVANSSDLALGESALFTYPTSDRSAILIHLASGDFVAYDAVCTHLGCQIHFDKEPIKGWENRKDNLFCACHGGVFDAKSGDVLAGPPPRPMPRIKLEIDTNGDIYANGYESGLPLYGEE